MERFKNIRVGNCKISLFGTIVGLTSETEEVKKAFYKSNANLITVAISENELQGLKNLDEKTIIELSSIEEVYAKKLAVYGEVKVPPPCWEQCLELSKENNVEIVAIDMNDEDYTNAFIENISTFSLYWHSFSVKRWKKKKFKSRSADEFVFEWDKTITKLKEFRNLELKREEYFVKKLKELSKNYERIFAVVELQRFPGVYEKIIS